MKYRLIPMLLVVLTQTACAENSVWDKPAQALDKPVAMTVYRSPTCGCCGKWIAHMRKQGFVVQDITSEAMDTVKQKLGIPAELQSCHTAVIGKHVVEGHVPAADVKTLLKTQPDTAAGLAAPGMPMASPGMEMAGAKANFSVILFDENGKAKTFNEYVDH